MESLPQNAISFVALLVRAEDPASLFEAFGKGLGPLFPHHSINASFDFDRKEHAHSVWSNVPQPRRTPEWSRRFTELNPGRPYIRKRIGIPVLCMDEVIHPRDLADHPFYQEFAKPAGWDHVLSIFVWRRDEVVGFVAINRRADQGAFTAEERACARALQPLIAAAYERIAAVRRDDDLRRAHEQVLRSLPLAVIVWSPRERRVLFHNRASKEAVAHWRGEAVAKRPRRVSARWLPDEIVAASDGLPRRGAEVLCPRGGLRAQLTRITSPQSVQRSHFAADVVLILVHEEGGHATPSAAWLHLASTFSTAELDVAKLAARGMSNAEIARVLGKSPLTVKKQLESIFDKAGVRGRTELASLFAALVPASSTAAG